MILIIMGTILIIVRRMGGRAIAGLLVALAVTLGACGDDATGDRPLRIVATTSILGDVAGAVAGDEAVVEVLMPVGTDAHAFQPSARQVASLSEAGLVVAVGLGLEEGLADVLANAASDGTAVLEIGPELRPRPLGSGPDPHVWMDPQRMGDAAGLLAAELERLDPGGGWSARADTYRAGLDAADRTIAELLASVPAERRKLVTNHEALGYFADRYGFEVVGVVIPGGSTQAEPSSADLADLVATIEREGVPAIFAETSDPATLAESVAAEAGGEVAVVELYTESLGAPGSGADTLAGMLITDAERIAAALG